MSSRKRQTVSDAPEHDATKKMRSVAAFAQPAVNDVTAVLAAVNNLFGEPAIYDKIMDFHKSLVALELPLVFEDMLNEANDCIHASTEVLQNAVEDARMHVTYVLNCIGAYLDEDDDSNVVVSGLETILGVLSTECCQTNVGFFVREAWASAVLGGGKAYIRSVIERRPMLYGVCFRVLTRCFELFSCDKTSEWRRVAELEWCQWLLTVLGNPSTFESTTLYILMAVSDLVGEIERMSRLSRGASGGTSSFRRELAVARAVVDEAEQENARGFGGRMALHVHLMHVISAMDDEEEESPNIVLMIWRQRERAMVGELADVVMSDMIELAGFPVRHEETNSGDFIYSLQRERVPW